MSTTDCDDDFTDIPGATSTNYTPPAPSTTTFYRLAARVFGTCNGSACEQVSNCVEVTVEDCCPVNNCVDITVTKN